MIGETREAIEAYCVAVGLVVYEWNDLHEKLAQLFAVVREGDKRETLAEWYAVRSDTSRLPARFCDLESVRLRRQPRVDGFTADRAVIVSDLPTRTFNDGPLRGSFRQTYHA
jgi:hypothetical protein